MWAGTGVLVWYASTKTFPSVHTDNGCSQWHCERVVCVVCLCLAVLEAPPTTTTTPASTSLRHVRNAAGRVGDEMKKREKRGQAQGATWLVRLFVSVVITCCLS